MRARSSKGNSSAESQFARGRARRRSRATNLPAAPSQLPVQAIVKAVGDNTLTVRIFEGNPTDGRTEHAFDVTVARPSEHRREVYDGTTNETGWLRTYVSATERSATKSGEATEAQKLAPPYEVDVSIIEIEKVRTAGGLTNASGVKIYWIDTNSNGRNWGIV